MKRSVVWRFLFAAGVLFFSACETELTRRKADELRQAIAEREQVERENEEIRAERKRGEQKTQTCNRAFLSFERAQAAREPRDAVALYREGLEVCPDDDVAHYELGNILAGMGRRDEAREEFEAALKINPNFKGARQELERLPKK
jgi:tetratricopeptide (TPR) repeat protein